MKKKLIVILSLIIFATTNITAFASAPSEDLANAIKLYKAGNYTQCYDAITELLKKEPPNALAYYYMAISAVQVGKKDEAIINYKRAISLSAPSSNITTYSNKGILCINSPEKCKTPVYSSEVEQFIRDFNSGSLSREVESELEKLKIDNLMREMNRNNDIDPQRFREYADFSSMNLKETPSNEEIVAALKTLQKAGLSNILGNNNIDLSMMGSMQGNSNALMNMMGSQSVNPQVLQTLLTNNMSLGF